MHRAAYYGHGETVTALLRAGAHVDAKSWSGKTALCYAALSKEHVIVMELMKWELVCYLSLSTMQNVKRNSWTSKMI